MLIGLNGIIAAVVIIGMNVIGMLGFSKNLFNSLFGAPVISDCLVYDLTKREALLYTFLVINLLGLNILTLAVF